MNHMLKESRSLRPLAIGITIYTGGYLLVHLLWTAINSRFVFPVLPFLTVYIVLGSSAIIAKGKRRWLAPILSVILMSNYLVKNIQSLKDATVSAPLFDRFPEETFSWIRQHVPTSGIFLYSKAPMLYLYTGHTGVAGLRARTPDEFREQLVAEGIQYVLIQPTRTITLKGFEAASTPDINWITFWPKAFTPIYQNKTEHTDVYQVVNQMTGV
jgi:hypothetical protein